MAPTSWSYTSGTSDVPLLGLTIGDMFDETVARFPDNEALVSRHQGLRYTYRQLQVEVDRCARALIALGVDKGQRVGIWAPNCAEWAITQFATSKLGAILVNINPSYRLNEVQYALRQSGCAWLVTAPRFKTSDYTAMMHELAPELASSQPGSLAGGQLPRSARRGAARRRAGAGDAELERAAGDGRADRRRRAGAPPAPAGVRRPHQHPVHERNHRLSQGRHAQSPQHPQQRLLHHRAAPLHRPRPAPDPRPALPLLRHGHGQPGLHVPRRDHDLSERRLRPAGRPGGRPGRGRHRALRRADHVHRRAEPSRLREIRPLHAAHRHHGWLPLSGGSHEAGAGADAHARCGLRLRHDGDQPGEHADAHRGAAGQAGRHGRPGASPRADQDRGPADRPGGAGRRARASCAPAATA